MTNFQHPAEQGSQAGDLVGIKEKSQKISGSQNPNLSLQSAFLPVNYEVPVSPSNYTKFEAGENRLRILASPIIGYEWWTEDDAGTRKPVRVPMNVEHPSDAKHFWAMPVWNYKHGRVQILEITQKSIQESLRTFAAGLEWGSPLHYDVSIIRQGEGRDTKYQVIPTPHSQIKPEVKVAYQQTAVNLDALFEGKDPFAIEANK